MTEAELYRLPAVIDVPTAARVLGIGRSHAYQLIKDGLWPTAVLRLGARIRVPSRPLIAYATCGPTDAAGPQPPERT